MALPDSETTVSSTFRGEQAFLTTLSSERIEEIHQYILHMIEITSLYACKIDHISITFQKDQERIQVLGIQIVGTQRSNTKIQQVFNFYVTDRFSHIPCVEALYGFAMSKTAGSVRTTTNLLENNPMLSFTIIDEFKKLEAFLSGKHLL